MSRKNVEQNVPATKRDVEEYAHDKPYLMVVVYADWCGHCKSMIDKLGNKFQQYDKLIFLEERQVNDDFKDYFPHVHIYQYGQQTEGTVDDLYNLLGLPPKSTLPH
jgi:thiol-disulfide isomerase/thioredoxin